MLTTREFNKLGDVLVASITQGGDYARESVLVRLCVGGGLRCAREAIPFALDTGDRFSNIPEHPPTSRPYVRHTHAMDKPTNLPTPRQLDIFADSRDVMLRNDLVHALMRRDGIASRRALAQLADVYPTHGLLASGAVLLTALTAAAKGAIGVPVDAASLAAARLHLRANVAPAATALLGMDDGPAWLAPLWRELARRHAHLLWTAAQPEDHSAPLWLAAGEWAQAHQSAASIAAWRRIPVPLAWMIEARYRLQGVDEIWPLLAELAWLAPKRLDTLLRVLGDPLLHRLRHRFEENFDAGGDPRDGHNALAWFPAWVLTDAPALAPRLALAERGQDSAPERGLRLLVQLLALERQGRHHQLVASRKVLRDLSATLYAAYMATR